MTSDVLSNQTVQILEIDYIYTDNRDRQQILNFLQPSPTKTTVS